MAPIHHLINENIPQSTLSSVVSHSGPATSNGNGVDSSIEKQFPGIDKNELTRLLIQALSDLGYDNASNVLKEESGLELDSPVINDLIAYIKNGDFEKAEATIDRLNLIDDSEAVKNKIRFLIKREKFLESLFLQPDTQPTLRILRNEIKELTTINDIRSLTALLMDKESKTLQKSNGWVGTTPEDARRFMLNEISKFINPNEMIPKFRLFKLLQQSIEYQKSINLYNFSEDDEKLSLYEDIKSNRSNFPDTIVKTLQHHTDEVWYVQFSHDGSKLATASADNTIHIYDVNDDFKLLKKLIGHEKSVLYASFSPDDKKLVTCGIESKARVWDIESGETEHILSLENERRIWCAEWYPNGENIVLGSPDREFAIFDSYTGGLVHKWESSVINCMTISASNKLFAGTYDKNIEIWDLETKAKVKTIEIGEAITSITVSKENPNTILINTSPNEIQLWDWNRKLLLNKYVGHRQEKYIIRSCFGYNERLIASGSEDGRIFIWNKEFGALLGAFDGHQNSNLNSVSWNPVDKSMFATCGDDGLVRIWGPAKRLGNS